MLPTAWEERRGLDNSTAVVVVVAAAVAPLLLRSLRGRRVGRTLPLNFVVHLRRRVRHLRYLPVFLRPCSREKIV